MKKCVKCGIENEDSSSFCKACGNSLTVQQTVAGIDTKVSTGLAPNVASLLCYVATWITGIVFLLIEKEDKNVRFHAWQSLLTFGILNILQVVLSAFYYWLPYMVMRGTFISVISIINWVIWIFILVLWIVLMVKAYQGDRFMVPVTGNIAYNLAFKGQETLKTQQKPVTTASEPVQSKAQQKPASAVQEQAPQTAQQKSAPAASARSSAVKSDAVKYCIICGSELPARALFCAKCGEKQQ